MSVEGEVQDELAPVALGVTRRLDENYVPAARLANWIVAACLGVSGCAGFLVLAFTAEWPAWAVIGAAVVLVLVLAALRARQRGVAGWWYLFAVWVHCLQAEDLWMTTISQGESIHFNGINDVC